MAFAAACDDNDTTQAAMTSASEQSIEFCGAPSVDEVGFTTFTDGTTGFTDECAAQMASIQPEPEPVADVNREAEVEIEAEPAPAPVPEPPAPAPAPASPSAYYPNCAAARAAGAAPLYEGDPGYSLRLDRDRDGIACE